MGWKDLLQQEDEQIAAAWLGGRALRVDVRKWSIVGRLPREHGVYSWKIRGNTAELMNVEAEFFVLPTRCGYLVGDLFVSDMEGGAITDPAQLAGSLDRVHLVEPGLDHFARVGVKRMWDEGPLIYVNQDFPAGPEGEVLDAYLDRKESIDHIPGVAPALDLVYRMKTWHRVEVERKAEEARARRELEEKRQRIRDRLGDGAMRRELALEDFEEAAKAALAVGGAEYIEHRPGQPGEYVVRYRIDGRRYECVCDVSMHIIDAGICLHDHTTGEKGDKYFTLESLPGVTRAAMDAGAAIWRHV